MAQFSGSTYSAAVDESKRLIALAMLGITKYDFDKTTNKLTLYMQDGTVVEAALTADSSSGNVGEAVEDKCITPWKAGETYQKDVSFVVYNGYIYFCSVTNNDDTFTESHWTKLADNFDELSVDDVKAFLNLTPEEISKLSDIISTEIRLDKTFSSSDTYMRIQAAINTAKEYTNNQLGKAVKPAYKVVSSTSEVTETGYFYLISNGTNFDMYVLSSDGTVVSLGTSEVDLSNYYTKTETDSDFLKKSDAASTYATIATVDGKVDKTDIVDNLTSTDTDKPLSANQGKVLKDEVDLKANDSDVVKKTDISTTIDGRSTNDTVPTSKSIYDNVVSKHEFREFKVKFGEPSDLTKIGISDYTTLTSLSDITKTLGKNYRLIMQVDGANRQILFDNGVIPYNNSGLLIITVLANRGSAYYITDDTLMFEATTPNAATTEWRTWKRVCNTSVSDVPLTTVPLDSSKFSNGHLRYEVKNGTCYVYINALNAKVTGLGYDINSSPMPKPSNSLVTAPIVCDGNGATIGLFYIDENFNSTPRCHIFTPSLNGYVTFSYPVAES